MTSVSTIFHRFQEDQNAHGTNKNNSEEEKEQEDVALGLKVVLFSLEMVNF